MSVEVAMELHILVLLLIFDFFWTTLSLLMHYYQMNVMQSVLVDVFMVSVTGVWFYIPN